MTKKIFEIKNLLIVFLLVFLSCQSNNSKKIIVPVAAIPAKVQLYYFHQPKGCPTCKAIGNLSKDFVDKNYGDKSNDLSYHDVNISLKENQALVDKFEVNWSGLYILAHTSKGDITDNLTELAFMYALTNPDTINLVLTNKISHFLKQ